MMALNCYIRLFSPFNKNKLSSALFLALIKALTFCQKIWIWIKSLSSLTVHSNYFWLKEWGVKQGISWPKITSQAKQCVFSGSLITAAVCACLYKTWHVLFLFSAWHNLLHVTFYLNFFLLSGRKVLTLVLSSCTEINCITFSELFICKDTTALLNSHCWIKQFLNKLKHCTYFLPY